MSRARSAVASFLFVLVCAAVVAGVIFQQEIRDQWKYREYTPNAQISQMTERSGMSERGKFYFYVAHPELGVAQDFNDECRRAEQGSPVLGCYNQATDKIHIYDITNQELDGVKEVTAAHEMLHVVFARLKSDELERLTDQLEAAYLQVRTDKLDERMAYYDRASPGSRVNELHSIIGTEFANIGSELEEYYREYFDDRQKVVQLHAGYSQKFEGIEREINSLNDELKVMNVTIESRISRYEAAIANLNAEIEIFNKRAESGYFKSMSEFERAKSQLTSRIDALKGERISISAMIDDYNNKVTRLNDLGGKMEELQKGLDSLEAVDGSVEKA